jgi:biopolymer transport protein ExbB
MKYFHSLIITGFLVPFLPIQAETGPEQTSQEEIAAEKEEDSLTSLDEELAKLDEEFEEFKEELISLENELLQQENSQIAFEALLKPDEMKNDLIAQNEEIAIEEDAAAFSTLLPEVEEQKELAFVEDSSLDEPLNDEEFEALFAEELSKISSEEFVNEEGLALENQAIGEPAVSSKAFAPVAIVKEAPAILNVQRAASIGEPMPLNDEAISVDLKQAFSGSPIIYTLLFGMSILALGIWFYSFLSLRSSTRLTTDTLRNLQNKLNSNQFDEALSLCQGREDLFSKMILSGIQSRRHGLPMMIEAMKAEGKRSSIAFWQKIGLLNDIAIIAPMLGLLGTVLGMFYAFYDVNRSIESISTLFDGLGISVGTTVAGLVVAILALILHSTAKYRLVRGLALVENEAQSLATLIDDRTSLYKGS